MIGIERLGEWSAGSTLALSVLRMYFISLCRFWWFCSVGRDNYNVMEFSLQL